MSAVTLALMGQGTLQPLAAPDIMPAGTWMRLEDTGTGPAAEMLDEGDGNVLIRSSFNRDRVLRLSLAELQQCVAMYFGGSVVTAPEVVTGG